MVDLPNDEPAPPPRSPPQHHSPPTCLTIDGWREIADANKKLAIRPATMPKEKPPAMHIARPFWRWCLICGLEDFDEYDVLFLTWFWALALPQGYARFENTQSIIGITSLLG